MKTSLLMVVDKSGSMHRCRGDAEGGLNNLIDQEKGENTVLTLVEFSTNVKYVHEATPIDEVEPYELRPMGWTALLDAVGTAIHGEGLRLHHMDEEDRPDLVSVVIVTDGKENMSHEYSFDQVKEMIAEQRDKYNWQFTFLCSDEGLYQVDRLGLGNNDVALYKTSGISNVYNAVSSRLGRSKFAVQTGGSLKSVNFTRQERDSMQEG